MLVGDGAVSHEEVATVKIVGKQAQE